MEVYHNGYVLWDKEDGKFLGQAGGNSTRTDELRFATMFASRESAEALKTQKYYWAPHIIVRTFRYILEAL